MNVPSIISVMQTCTETYLVLFSAFDACSFGIKLSQLLLESWKSTVLH